METVAPAGTAHTVGKCERAQRKTVGENWEEVESGTVSRIRSAGDSEGIQRTGDELSRRVSRKKLSVDQLSASILPESQHRHLPGVKLSSAPRRIEGPPRITCSRL